MPSAYATFAQFTDVYSVKGVAAAELNSYWLPYGSLRVNESLGGKFTTPFSSNNHTARDLSIHFAYLGLLQRTRNKEDSQEILGEVTRRIKSIVGGNTPMITDSGDILFASASVSNDAWS